MRRSSEGIRRLYFGSRFSRADTSDVRAAFEKESGENLERFFDAWIYGSGTPAVAFSWAPAADLEERAVALRVEQRGKDSEFPVTVTLEYAGGATEDTQIFVRERTAEFRLPIKGPLRNVTLNRDGLTPLEMVGSRQKQSRGPLTIVRSQKTASCHGRSYLCSGFCFRLSVSCRSGRCPDTRSRNPAGSP